ncbi:MAG: hypothetical protein PVG14_15210 [Anaerolineales bacterium]|jgi:hypothetical protein
MRKVLKPGELLNREYLYKLPSDDFRASHQRFIELQNTDHPLVGVYRHSIYPMAEFIRFLDDGEVKPEDINSDDWIDVYDDNFIQTGLMWGDLILWASPLNGFPWLEAILGCPIFVSHDSNSVWAEQSTKFTLGDEIVFDPTNPWLYKLLEATKALVECSDGRFPVASGIMRGISDLIVALLGSTQFYLALYDSPEKLFQLAESLADFWVWVVSEQYSAIPPFANGYVNAGLWTPGTCPVYQEDAAALISAKHFEQIIGIHSRRVLNSFEFPILHLHSDGLQIVDSFLCMEKLPVIEINIDPAGPEPGALIPIFKRIQQKAPLEIFGTAEEIYLCLEKLHYDGLACLILESSLEEFNG